jgi:RNA polymerase sigma factor (sigma-70 family)
LHQHPLIRSDEAFERRVAPSPDAARPRVVRHAEPGTQDGVRDGSDVAALVRAAESGDQDAWRALVGRFTPALRSAARGFSLAPADVDDVVQNTWLAAFRHIRRLEKPEAFGGWLLVTARRESLLTYQRSVREIVTDDPPALAAPEHEGIEAAVIAKERQDAIHAAARRLPARQRTLVRALLNVPASSYDDLSVGLRMPIGSIGPTRERALQRLRRDPRLLAVVAAPAA